MTTEGYLSSAEAPPKPSRSHIKTRALWALALLVGILGFASGRMTSGIRLLPALAATLPGDEPEFSREIDERVRELFPAGDQRKKTPPMRRLSYGQACSVRKSLGRFGGTIPVAL